MFQIGDRVRVVKNTSGSYAYFDAKCIGKEGKVVGHFLNRNMPWIRVQLDDDDDWMAFMPEELGPVEPAAKFRTGDTVRILPPPRGVPSSYQEAIGWIGMISEVYDLTIRQVHFTDHEPDRLWFMIQELCPVNVVIPNLDGTCTIHDFVTDRNLRLRPEHAKLIFAQNERILQSVSPSEE